MGSNVPHKDPLGKSSYLLEVFKIGTKSVLGVLLKESTKSQGIIPCGK